MIFNVIQRSLLMLLMMAFMMPIQTHAGDNLSSIHKRPFHPMLNGKWIGNGISYGAFRDGESPDNGKLTSKANILEDLKLISQRWHLIRMYSADQQSQNILEVIKEYQLPIRVMQGVWLSGHQTDAQNQQQINFAIQLANQFPDIIVAVNVGNEIFVDWSAHKVADMDKIIAYIRQVRSQTKQPVTVNDDYNFWNKPQAKRIANEVDFIGLHAYAFWNNKTLEEAMTWTTGIYEDIQYRFPNHTVALCESGWPTSRVYRGDSYEGGLIGKAGEAEQHTFFKAFNAWINHNHIHAFYFEAFDENWKGGFDGKNPKQKSEKHWGLYNADRTPKLAIK